MKNLLLAALSFFACSYSSAQTYVYSTGIVRPGLQVQIGPVVRVQRPYAYRVYVPNNYSHYGFYDNYGDLYAPYNYRPPYLAPRVNIFVR